VAKRKRTVTRVELRPIRKQIASHAKAVRAAIEERMETGQTTKELRAALRSLGRMEKNIQSICGSDMAIPIR
jgi:hypothetical protein